MRLNIMAWGVYALFALLALAFNWHPDIFVFNGPMAFAKIAIWLVYLAFLIYSIYCSTKENLFKTAVKISRFHWGRQIGIDLYIGVALSLLLIYLHEGTLAVALWLLPSLAFANLSILLYFAIHFESIVSKLLV
ncbi:MAG: hypothetical protein AAF639_08610 [Chloroflexota bacterium]